MSPAARAGRRAALISLAVTVPLALLDVHLSHPDDTRPHMPTPYTVQADDSPKAPHRWTPSPTIARACAVVADPAECVDHWTKTGELPR